MQSKKDWVMFMYKIAIVGDRDSIMGFKAIGISIFPASDYHEAHKIILRLANEAYAVIFLTERLAIDMDETLNEFKEKVIPTIILVPDNLGSIGLGMAGIKKNVEKAIGADILFGKEG